jgi:hypothetical protein
MQKLDRFCTAGLWILLAERELVEGECSLVVIAGSRRGGLELEYLILLFCGRNNFSCFESTSVSIT